jgi:hypothetical protein
VKVTAPITLQGLLDLVGARRSGDSWVGRCPAHEDRTPSLSVCERDGKILLHCFAGCTYEATLLHDAGESLKTAQALLGHSDLETTLGVYTHAVPDSQKRSVERVAWVLDLDGPNFGPEMIPKGRIN